MRFNIHYIKLRIIFLTLYSTIIIYTLDSLFECALDPLFEASFISLFFFAQIYYLVIGYMIYFFFDYIY